MRISTCHPIPPIHHLDHRTRHAAADNKSAPEPHVLEACKQMFPMWKLGSILPEPTYLRKTAPRNRERSFTRSLNARLSEIWRTQLMSHYPGDDAPKTRMSAYISIAVYDLERRDLFKPAAFIVSPTKVSIRALLRQRTQNSRVIPAHAHLQLNDSGMFARHQYEARACTLCQSPGVTGSERHYLGSCSHTQEAREQAIRSVTHTLPYVGLPKWQTLSIADRTRFLCASCLPMRSQQSRVKRSLWMTKTVNIAAILAVSIQSSLSLG